MISSAVRSRLLLRRFSSILTTQSANSTCSSSSSSRDSCISGRNSCSRSGVGCVGSLRVHSRGKYSSIWCANSNIHGTQRGKSIITRLYSSSSISQFKQHTTTGKRLIDDEEEEFETDMEYPHFDYSFDADFYVQNVKDFMAVKPGGYMNIDKDEIDKFFPEGLTEGSTKEFEYTNRSTWMIRDISKLLCGLVDTYAMKKGLPQAQT